MVESKYVILQMIPHTLFIEWDFGHCLLAVLLFMTLFTRCLLFMALFTSRYKILFTYTVLFMYTVLFTYMVLFIRLVFFFFKCSFLDLFNQKFYA